MRETWVQSLGQEDPQKKEMATHASILVWRIPWTEELDGLQSTGSQSVAHGWLTLHFTLLTLPKLAPSFSALLLIQLRHQSEVFPDTPSPWPGKIPLYSPSFVYLFYRYFLSHCITTVNVFVFSFHSFVSSSFISVFPGQAKYLGY